MNKTTMSILAAVFCLGARARAAQTNLQSAYQKAADILPKTSKDAALIGPICWQRKGYVGLLKEKDLGDLKKLQFPNKICIDKISVPEEIHTPRDRGMTVSDIFGNIDNNSFHEKIYSNKGAPSALQGRFMLIVSYDDLSSKYITSDMDIAFNYTPSAKRIDPASVKLTVEATLSDDDAKDPDRNETLVFDRK